MQCNQPLWSPGFQNSAQFSPYQIQPNYPEVIGEGDVVPLTLPDGSIQYYFLPASRAQRWIPYPINSNTPTVLPVWSNANTEAWFIRSMLNTYPSANSNQNYTFSYGSYPARSVNLNAPGYVQKVLCPPICTCILAEIPHTFGSRPVISRVQWDLYNKRLKKSFTYSPATVKYIRRILSSDVASPSFKQARFEKEEFHNDNWTSTTDLHYFYPRLQNDWLARGCAAIQVEVPKEERTIYHYGTVCNRPCHCSSNDKKISETNNDKTCCDGAPMCVDEIKSDSGNQCCCDEKSKEKPSRNSTSNNKISHICGCHSRSNIKTSDKLVTTYTDQGSSCIDIKGLEKKKTKRKSPRSSNREVDACNSACCLGSPCSD